jgi:hypothetical protein
LAAGGLDRINVQNNPINAIDPYGLIKKKILSPAIKRVVKWAANKIIRKHHTVPSEILKKYLPKNIANNPLVRGKKGAPNIWKIPKKLHDEIHQGAGGGAWNEAWKTELRSLRREPTVNDIVKIRNKLVKEFGLEKYRPGTESAKAWLSQTSVYLAPAVLASLEALDYTDPISAVLAILGPKECY